MRLGKSGWRGWSTMAFALALFLASCHPQAQHSNLENAGIELHCFYLLDQKYAADQDPGQAEAWRASVRADGDASRHKDLFSHRGGGPLGAEWNSDGSIFITATLPWLPNKIARTRLMLNGKHWIQGLHMQAAGGKTWLEAEVPSTSWQAFLRPIQAGDYPLLYSSEDIGQAEHAPAGPLGVGRILVVRLEMWVDGMKGKQTVERAFHWAEGE